MIRLVLVAILALAGFGHATVTAAWKVPIEHFAPDYENDDHVHKLEMPPGESAFFEPGDELWEISKALQPRMVPDDPEDPEDPFGPQADERDFDWQGDWVVWNARSGVVVARGSWNDLRQVEQGVGFRDFPEVLQGTLEIVNPRAEVEHSISAVLRDKSRVRIRGVELGMDTLVAKSGWVDLRGGFSWPADLEGERWEVSNNVTLRLGRRTRLARVGQGERVREVFLTISVESIEGTPINELRWVENATGIEAWEVIPDRVRKVSRKRLGPGRHLGVYPVPPDIVRRLTGEDRELPVVDAPAELAKRVGGPLVDLRSPLESTGLKCEKPGDFAGFDPRTNLVFVIVDSINQDLAEWIFFGGGDPLPRSLVWVEAETEAGGWGLAAASGGKSGILRKADQSGAPVFQIEPTVDGSGEFVELGYELHLPSDDEAVGMMKSHVMLRNGKPRVAGRYSKAGAEEVEVTITARVHLD